MSSSKKIRLTGRGKRARRVRKTVTGTAERPRLSVFRSLNHIYAQIIDDEKMVTLLGLSSLCKEMKETKSEGGKIATSKQLGKLVAEKAKEKGITKVVFDRSGFLYHGRVKAVADGAREGGLNF